MNKQKELADLKVQLQEMERSHVYSWEMYGSELSSGDMSRRESELTSKIKALEAEIKNDSESATAVDR